MKELTIQEKAKAYDEAIKYAHHLINEHCKEGTDCSFHRADLQKMFPELAESEDEKIRKMLIEQMKRWHECALENNVVQDIKESADVIAWLEKQGNIDLEFFENGENEKCEFVGYGLLKCKGDFLSFKEGETYVLEYMGKDNYYVRSDNLLGQTFHITPQQLYTVFRPTTWIEKQYNKPQGKSAQEAINEEKVDNANKVEPKFRVGDWITNGNATCQITFIDSRYWYSETCVLGNVIDIDKTFHLWTIEDAKPGDVLANGHHILVLKELDYDWYTNGTPYSVHAYCGIKPNGNFEIGKENWCFCGTLHTHPATKEQCDTLEKAMADAGYTFDFDKKELKKIDHNIARLNTLENIWRD